MMNYRIILVLLISIISTGAFSQPTNAVTDPEKKFKEAKELFLQEQYALAYPLLNSLKESYPDNTTSDHAYLNEDLNYYYIVCRLKLKQPVAEQEAKRYINLVANEPRRQLLSFHLAQYYFNLEDYSSALEYYEKTGIENFSNAEIADMKFEKGYCYFNGREFAKAKPLFEEISQLDDNKYFYDANYYYGYLSFVDRQYAEAMRTLKLAGTQEKYKDVVPYYIAELYYLTGKKEEALRYSESILGQGQNLLNRKQLSLLTGQLYFEKKEYDKALPLLEEYVKETEKVSKELLYELSYCYYMAKQLDKAIEGFKQLSSETDSLGQNSMYLLGDCYLQTGDKANARTAFQFCANNNSNAKQQQVSRFTYAKLSYELGFQDIAMEELKKYLADHPGSENDAEAKEILVGLLANTNNFADAMQLYESFKKPTASMKAVYPRIMYGRAVELVNDQKFEEADEMLTKLIMLPKSSTTPFAYFWKGEIAYQQKDYDAAIRNLSFYVETGAGTLGEANPQTAKYNLGYSWLQKENYTKALTFFEQISTVVSPTTPPLEQDAYVRSADCYFMNREFEKANAMYDNVINSALPQSDYALFQKAMIASIKNSTEKIRIMNTLTKAYPKSSMVADVQMEIADTYMADEKFSEAIPFLNNLLKNKDAGGLKAATYLKLGLCYYNTNRNAEALNYYQTLIKLYPQSPEADEALANTRNIYVEEGRPEEYIDLMNENGKSVSGSEADSLTYIAAEGKYTAGDCNAAINGFNNYLSKFPNGTRALDAHYFMAECYSKAKDYANAVQHYDYVNGKGLNRYFERSTMEAARLSYFELKDYEAAKKYFQSGLASSVNQTNQLEALRGLVRCFYQLKDFDQANDVAKTLLTKKGLSTDDKSIAFLVLGKSQQVNNDPAGAIASFKSCAAINKTAWGAEARYEIAHSLFDLGNLAAAEKAGLAVIKETGSYDLWVTKSYILLGDVFMQQKDYFNAKATYESVAKNSVIPELKNEAKQKLERAIAEEKATSKIDQP